MPGVRGQVWGATHALKLSGSSPAWEPGESGKCEGAGKHTGGNALSRMRTCRTKPVGGATYDEVSRIDPATGKAKWTYTSIPRRAASTSGCPTAVRSSAPTRSCCTRTART